MSSWCRGWSLDPGDLVEDGHQDGGAHFLSYNTYHTALLAAGPAGEADINWAHRHWSLMVTASGGFGDFYCPLGTWVGNVERMDRRGALSVSLP